jgi:thiosulfate/3-mercaptopyruvate sulfurtransferase
MLQYRMAWHTTLSATELAAHLDDPTWRVFDCRHDLANPQAGEAAYRLGHIAGAQFLHLDRDLAGPLSGRNGRHPLPAPAAFAALLARRGVANDSQVIVYDDIGGAYAARLWWMLRWLGHDAVALLDGGMQAWQGAGYAQSDRIPQVQPARFDWKLSEPTVNTADIAAQLPRPGMMLIDARSPDRYRGENETIDPVAGHIPGAINRPFRDNLDPTGRFKTAARLRREFAGLLGARPAETTVCYCGSGVTACHNLLAMEIAGLSGAQLYPGSWSEWCSDPARPVATGAH